MGNKSVVKLGEHHPHKQLVFKLGEHHPHKQWDGDLTSDICFLFVFVLFLKQVLIMGGLNTASNQFGKKLINDPFNILIRDLG